MTIGMRSSGLRLRYRLLILVLVGIQATFCWMARGRSLRGEVDLRAFYSAGDTVRQGHAHELYLPAPEAETQRTLFAGQGRTFPFLYPAFAALPFVPLSALPYRAAFGVVFAVNLLCLFTCAWMLGGSGMPTGLARGWLFLLYLDFFPVAIALMQGQISCMLLLCFTGVDRLLRRERDLLAGLLLSLALVKFQLALPIALLFLAGRRFRIVGGFLAGAGVLALVSLWLVGLPGVEHYIARMRGVGSTMLLDPRAAELHFGMQPAAEPNLHGLLTSLCGAGTPGVLLTVTLSLVVLLWTARRRPAMATAVPAAMLVSYHMQPYDLILLLLPLSLMLHEPARMMLRTRLRLPVPALLGLLTLSIPVGPLLLAHGLNAWFALGVLLIALGLGRLSCGLGKEADSAVYAFPSSLPA